MKKYKLIKEINVIYGENIYVYKPQILYSYKMTSEEGQERMIPEKICIFNPEYFQEVKTRKKVKRMLQDEIYYNLSYNDFQGIFEICKSSEEYDCAYESDNYFLTKEEAKRCCDELNEIVKETLRKYSENASETVEVEDE